MVARCGQMEFNLNGEEVDERVENLPTFQYLGRLLHQMDDDWPAVRQYIMHARLVWGGARENTLTERGISQGVGKFIQGGGAGDSTVWVRNIGPFGVNGKYDLVDAHGVLVNDHREDSEAIRRWDMVEAWNRRHMRGRVYPVG